MTTTQNRHGSATVELQGDRELVITRTFDAPAALVFKAMTTPELVQRWWGFETAEWKVCEIDATVGGTWRYVVSQNDFEVAFHGTYEEIDAPSRIVSTEVFEGADPGDDSTASRNTVTLVEQDGTTTMTTHVRHALPEHRDAQLQAGMEGGMQVSFDRLEDLVRSLAA